AGSTRISPLARQATCRRPDLEPHPVDIVERLVGVPTVARLEPVVQGARLAVPGRDHRGISDDLGRLQLERAGHLLSAEAGQLVGGLSDAVCDVLAASQRHVIPRPQKPEVYHTVQSCTLPCATVTTPS